MSKLSTSEIAEKIKEYLSKRPNAADTIEGIHYWFSKSRIDISSQSIDSVLEGLIEKGDVDKVMHNSKEIYRFTNRQIRKEPDQ
jgi:hypothetical protein